MNAANSLKSSSVGKGKGFSRVFKKICHVKARRPSPDVNAIRSELKKTLKNGGVGLSSLKRTSGLFEKSMAIRGAILVGPGRLQEFAAKDGGGKGSGTAGADRLPSSEGGMRRSLDQSVFRKGVTSTLGSFLL